MKPEELSKRLEEHNKWLNGSEGKRAYLRGANLWGAADRPYLPADAADREIERLTGIIEALKAANAELQLLLKKASNGRN